MEAKNKIVKIGKICDVVFKVLYCLSFVACATFVVLAIALSCTNAVNAFSAGETAILFGTLALYAFIAIGLFWNIEGVFKSIVKEHTLLCESVNHYMIKTGIFLMAVATVPAVVGTILLHSITPATGLSFPVDAGGIIAGAVLLLLTKFLRLEKEALTND